MLLHKLPQCWNDGVSPFRFADLDDTDSVAVTRHSQKMPKERFEDGISPSAP